MFDKLYASFNVRTMLVRDAAPTTLPAFTSSGAVYKWFKGLQTFDRELFMVLLLDTKQQLTGFQVVSIGTLNSTIVHPREVFKSAIVGNAASIICIHNHPSGNPTPSKEDNDITTRLCEAGKILGIRVLDHIIFGADGYVSYLDRGLLQ